MSRQQQFVRIECAEIGHETDKAVLITVDGDKYGIYEPMWIPLSQVDEICRNDPGGLYIMVASWIAREKGLQ